MASTATNTPAPEEPKLLGPFLGYVTSHSIKIWLHLESKPQTIYVSLHEGNVKAPQAAAGVLNLRKENLLSIHQNGLDRVSVAAKPARYAQQKLAVPSSNLNDASGLSLLHHEA